MNYTLFVLQFNFLLSRAENERKGTNHNEKFIPVPFQTLVILFAIRSYQSEQSGTNANPDKDIDSGTFLTIIIIMRDH